jgi:hypothetical protein
MSIAYASVRTKEMVSAVSKSKTLGSLLGGSSSSPTQVQPGKNSSVDSDLTGLAS